MADQGATTPGGKDPHRRARKTDQAGYGRGLRPAAGLGPKRLVRISGEHWSMENVRSNFKGRQDPVYRLYRLAKTREDRGRVIRDMQRFWLSVG